MSKRTLVLALIITSGVRAALATNPAGFGPESAAGSLKGFKLPAGLEVSLFASEPFVRNPTDMDIDARGRVWITEGMNYRSSFKPWGMLQPGGDRILILEDTDGDGKADKQTVFYQDPSINAALGVCVLGNKVIVSDSPNVFVLTDTDGDGKADKRELLFTGIGGFDHDHGVHAFSFGPDGKLYFNMGNESKQLRWPLNKDVPLHGVITNAPSKPVIDVDGKEVDNEGKPYQMGMIFRCNPDGTGVETLAWNFRNNYEVAVDSFGNLWQSDNDDDGNQGVRINYVMEYGNYGYRDEMTAATWREGWEKARLRGTPDDKKIFYEWHQYDPGVVPNLLHTGAGSPTGIAVYEGKLLPEIFRNQVIHCDAGPRVVRSYPVERSGAGFKAKIENILTTEDTWFRPSDVCVAPDGSVFVADWNDANVGGHNMADQNPHDMTGRVYRIAPAAKGATAYHAPQVSLQTAVGCVSALQSPNIATRYLAWTKLHEMQGKAAGALSKIWKGNDPRMRARALQLLARIKGSEKRYVQEASKDSNPDIRIVGLRIARELKLDVIPLVEQLAHDGKAAVRRECAIALRHNNSPRAPKAWAELALRQEDADRWYLEALGIGADQQWDAFLAAWRQKVVSKWNSTAGRDIVWRSRSRDTSALLATIIASGKIKADEQAHYFRAFDFQSGPEKNAALLTLLKSTNLGPGTMATEVLARLQGVNSETSPEVAAGLQTALSQLKGTAQFVEIVRDFKIKGQDDALLAFALKEPTSSTAAEALRLILQDGKSDLIETALEKTNGTRLILPLGNTMEKEGALLLEPLITQTSRDFATRKQTVKALAQTQTGAMSLIKLAKNQELPEDLKFCAAAELNNARWAKVKTEAEQVLPLPKTADSQPLPPVAELVKMKGNATNGVKVFRRDAVGCIKCHQVNGEGLDFGPSLSDIGTKLGKDALYESILDPSAGISFGYEAWRITLKNGDDASGLIVSDTADDVTLKAIGGVVTHYKKSDIASRAQQKLSIMPAGLQQTMSPQELVDLVEYLATLKTKGTANR